MASISLLEAGATSFSPILNWQASDKIGTEFLWDSHEGGWSEDLI
jgi:hypothetical protein